MRDEDRTLKNLLALYDEARRIAVLHEKVTLKLLDRLFAGRKYKTSKNSDYRQGFFRAGFDEGGTLIVYDFGWSHHHGQTYRSYSHTCYREGPHSERFLKDHNPEDVRLKGPESGDLEALAWIATEERAHDEWEAKWRKAVSWTPRFDKLVRAFEKESRRGRQLWMRTGLVQVFMGKVAKQQIEEQKKTLHGESYGAGSGLYSYREGVGPRVMICGRPFYFRGQDLHEGEPFNTFTFDGSETLTWRCWDQEVAWHGKGAEAKRAVRTMRSSDLRRYVEQQKRRKE